MNKEYLINQRPLKALLVFAFPIMIGNLFQQFYTMADSVVVGRFVGEVLPWLHGASLLTDQCIQPLSPSAAASVPPLLRARLFGSRDYTKMKRSISTALLTFLGLSILLGAFGLWQSSAIMLFLNTPSNIMGQAAECLNIYFLGLPFLFMYNVLSSMFNALGRSRIPLYLFIFSSVFNILLDIYMVYSLGSRSSRSRMGYAYSPGHLCNHRLYSVFERTEGIPRCAYCTVRQRGTEGNDQNRASLYPSAVHGLHRHDAGTVGCQQFWFRNPGRILRCHARRGPVLRPHGRNG